MFKSDAARTRQRLSARKGRTLPPGRGKFPHSTTESFRNT
ncbi:sugar kinase, partial [Escherichia coli]|nr:sugar kinase [Escherichia coli]